MDTAFLVAYGLAAWLAAGALVAAVYHLAKRHHIERCCPKEES